MGNEPHMQALPHPTRQFKAWYASLQATMRSLERIERDFEAETGLPHSWYELLIRLYKEPERRLRMSDLADTVLVSPGGATRMVARMEEAGLVKREILPEDRRSTWAVLTADGIARTEAACAVHFGIVDRYFADAITEREAETMIRLATKILAHVGEDCPWVLEDDAGLESDAATGTGPAASRR